MAILPFSLVYEDGDVLVVDKPSGLVVHPTHAHAGGTLWNDLCAYFDATGIAGRPGLIHRLDKDTSGLLIVAKTPAVHRNLHHQFERRLVTKGYLALVAGRPPTACGAIDAPLGRDPLDRRRVRVVPPGDVVPDEAPDGAPRSLFSIQRSARTLYRLLRRWPDHALLRLWPETGRTHQLRVHLAHIGLPISGDAVYNPHDASTPRLMLHADTLGVTLPSGMVHTFHTGLPADMKTCLPRPS